MNRFTTLSLIVFVIISVLVMEVKTQPEQGGLGVNPQNNLIYRQNTKKQNLDYAAALN